MNIEVQFIETYSPTWIDQILEIHNKTELKRGYDRRKIICDAFQSSFAVVTAWKNTQLVGCGRMISDGQMYSGIFDVVIDPEFQKMGIGREIVKRLIAKAPQTCIHLTSTFGKEAFYAKLGFKKHKTAMALYPGNMSMSTYLETWSPNNSQHFIGMVIEESLNDPTVLNEISVKKVQITSPGSWHIYTFTTPDLHVERYMSWIKDGPWYMHFWRDNEIVVVFKDRFFTFMKDDPSSRQPAIDHGKSMGIPLEQLDFITTRPK